MLDADVTDSVIGEGCVIKVSSHGDKDVFGSYFGPSLGARTNWDQYNLWELF